VLFAFSSAKFAPFNTAPYLELIKIQKPSRFGLPCERVDPAYGSPRGETRLRYVLWWQWIFGHRCQ